MASLFNRRRFVAFGVGSGAAALLAACGQAAPAATPAPVKPADAPKPTTAPAAPKAAEPTKPAAAATKPAEGTKPAAAATKPAEGTKPAAAKPATGTQPAQLKIAGWYDKGTQQSVEKQIELFRQKFPNVDVSVVVMEFGVEKNVVMMASGSAPDVFWVNNDQTAPWASRNALYALDDYIKRDGINLEDLFDIGKFLYSYQGKMYGLPEYLGPLMMMYNPKLFEAAGVPPPPSDHKDPGWTLDALIEKAKQLTKRPASGPAEQYGFFISTSINRWFPMLWDFGADVVDSAENPTKITFDSAGTRQAVQWVADLRLKHNVTATVAEGQGLPMQAQFQNGRLAMLVEGPWMWPTFNAEAVRSKVPWEIAPMPRGPGGTFTRMAGNAYGMSSQTKSPDAAWELLKFTTVGEGQMINWSPELAKGIPGVKSLAQDQRFGSWLSPRSKTAMMQLPEYSRISPKHPNWAEVFSKLDPELDQVWVGKLPVEQGVKNAHARMEEAFGRSR